jgi:hypothetical protein
VPFAVGDRRLVGEVEVQRPPGDEACGGAGAGADRQRLDPPRIQVRFTEKRRDGADRILGRLAEGSDTEAVALEDERRSRRRATRSDWVRRDRRGDARRRIGAGHGRNDGRAVAR